MTEIREIKEPVRYPKFKKARTQFSEEEILRLAEGMYLIEVNRKGGVIDE